ncbi:DUF6316 family protein [Microbulbifer thermotolerans]|uniref:DUF6316 family protein n=1 Tax=Microbulbifer thermotolerans TaxID=252514 RepID=UPI00224B593F|nr:DUF6316 family protein [Microbulbifer thermotolerans]MCX2783634.1 DUF6316 family protein [Microbulbifer thermotolerans]MCX2836174.1 DUF6316 family protein [Microbulbifer thermotolerans]
MQRHRAGEERRPLPPRSDRFYKLGDDWYFQVRGGACFGPYPCREEARRAVEQFFKREKDGSERKIALIHPLINRRA